MTSKNLMKREVLMWIFLALPFVAILVGWNDFPDRMPVHYNLEGEPDRYGSKFFGLLLIPLINLFTYFLLRFIPNLDPKKVNFTKFADHYLAIRLVTHLFLTCIFTFVALASLGYRFNFPLLVMYAVAILILVFGNYMRTIRHNYFVGVRTPWTLSNEKVWIATHRFTAVLWVVASLVLMIWLPFAKKLTLPLTLYLITIAFVPICYSYIMFQRVVKYGRDV